MMDGNSKSCFSTYSTVLLQQDSIDRFASYARRPRRNGANEPLSDKRPWLSGLMAAFLLLAPLSGHAETSVGRTGNFAIPGPTPRCDGAFDALTSGLDAITDGATYLGETTIEGTIGVTELLQGNPDALIDVVNDTFSDAASAASSLADYTPLALMSILVDVLPDGQVTDFLAKGTEFLQTAQVAVINGTVEGLNPIKLAETALNDLDEIAGDLLKVVENLDDPLSAGNEFLKLQQKWTGAGSLTYMFTEKDPLTGLKKALTAMHRQVEIVTTYSGGIGGALTPSYDVQSALLSHAMKESKKYISQLPDGAARRASITLAATFATAFKTSISDPNFDPNAHVARHPLFLAERRMVDLKWLGNDHDSGGKYDFGLQHPVVENKPGCISLGDRIYAGKLKTEQGPAICGVESGRNKWWSRPIDYKVVWGSNCAGGSHDLSVWQPVCEKGYVSVGFVAHNTASGTKPLPNAVACIKSDPLLLSVEDGLDAGLEWVATDENSGSKFDGTFYMRDFLGLPLMHGISGYKSSGDDIFVKSLRIGVPARGTAPSHAKARCVNFYSEPFFGGWTREICDLDVRSNLSDPGTATVLQGDGVSSFQCGAEVAGVEVFSSTQGSKTFNCDEGGHLGAYDDFGSAVTTLSSYTLSNGKTVRSPQAIEDAKLIAQKAERDRVARQRAAELAVQIVATYKSQCENESMENSCLNLGRIYSTGTPNIARDVVASEFYLRRACDLGEVENGCSTLRTLVANACGEESIATMCTQLAGIYYLDSLPGVAEDYPRARGLYDLACNFLDTSDPYACRRYGDMQLNGVGGPVDLEGAYTAYRDSCEMDEGYGCNSTAHFFRQGVFVARDLDSARVYYEKTCALGIAEGCDSIRRVNEEQAAEEAEAERIRLAEAAVADTDGDGMLDDWELANAFDPEDPSDAAEDWDMDGISNLDEFTAGTDARDTAPETTDTEGDDSDTVVDTGEVASGGSGGGSFGTAMLMLLSFRMLMGFVRPALLKP